MEILIINSLAMNGDTESPFSIAEENARGKIPGMFYVWDWLLELRLIIVCGSILGFAHFFYAT
ncbi:MAG: hypothetical protein HFH68_06775 [Lachnospiraceae bacterium]|nr:hypothetical protein [Lachnospiraceae bacterium]